MEAYCGDLFAPVPAELRGRVDVVVSVVPYVPTPALALLPHDTLAFETPLSQGLAYERRAFHALFATADQKEGMAAFAAKRKPDFQDK